MRNIQTVQQQQQQQKNYTKAKIEHWCLQMDMDKLTEIFGAIFNRVICKTDLMYEKFVLNLLILSFDDVKLKLLA